MLLSACGEDEGSFSQHPGFAAYYAANPRSDALPDAGGQQLLDRYRPRLFVGPAQEGPIGFYADYIAHGTLTLGDGTTVELVDRDILNAARDDPYAQFDHDPPPQSDPVPVAYGRIDQFEDPSGRMMTALTYHFVFRYSGLVAGLPWWKEWPARILSDPDDWHQLDHYTAFRLILHDDRPVAVWMQQHNFMRTHLIGETVDWPDDDRFRIVAAIRSNELYTYRPGRTAHRAISFPTEDNLRYLIVGGDPPMTGGHDITEPVTEIDYRIEFLPPSDAFYSFQGRLGEERLIWPRSGPPGADYNTLPAFKPLWRQLAGGYFRDGDEGDLKRLGGIRFEATGGEVEAQAAILAHNIGCLIRDRQDCDLR
ncbi:hypothetical protein [Minwuia sp.]|uniref:hypothetical protein n=1 Tax=Minwuia sp. TaxID=2493630 RepID=UPI003A8FF49F